MKTQQILSAALSLAMTAVSVNISVLAADSSTEKGTRSVYIHADSDLINTSNSSTAYLGETTNVYLAVDNPNKGQYDVTSNTHLEPQYDMNGYTVRFYYDPQYFDFAGPNAASPINYRLPNEQWDGSTVIIDGTQVEQKADVGYYVFREGSDTRTINGKSYNSAYVTVFFSGTYLPQKPDSDNWYNLCSLPLKPIKKGSTDVFIEADTTDETSLELFAKDVSSEYPPTFSYTTVNGGYHTINIKDKARPAAPIAKPIAGSYTETQTVSLTADDDCDIYYSLNDGEYIKYEKPFEVSMTTEVKCYAVRQTDAQKSNTVSYVYRLVPTAPHLFIDNAGQKQLVSNIYNSNAAFTVYGTDSSNWGNISDDSEVYYTFSQSASASAPEFGDDPNTQWVKLDKITQSIDITKSCIVRLITKKQEELSEAAWYSFGIRPSKPAADKETGVYDGKIDVSLTCETADAEIYYTIDGSDPRSGGILYTGNPLNFYKDTTLRAVSKYNDVYSEISTYYYQFERYDSYAVTAFYPPGMYEDSVKVNLTAENPDNTIYYSTDNVNWNKYTAGDVLNITDDTTIYAYAQDEAGKKGDIYTFIYKIKPKPPLFSPEAAQFTNSGEVTVFSQYQGDNYELLYTVDGSDPTVNGIKADGDSVIINISKYTVIRAVVRKNGNVYSDVVSKTYDIVKSKPAQPIMTLAQGGYIRKIGDSEGYKTRFRPVAGGVKIYYTIAYKNSSGELSVKDPVPGGEGTFEYVTDTDIEVKGETLIKAIAVNALGVKSDIAIFDYVITPEAPKLPPSADVTDRLPVVPVNAVMGSQTVYDINGNTNSVVSESGIFWLDTATGNAYEDEECTKPLGTPMNKAIESPAVINIYSVLDEISSPENSYRYRVSDNSEVIAAPYADKESGTYDEIDINGNGDMLSVGVGCLTKDAEIQYMENNSGRWVKYTGNILLADDTVLQLRAVKNGKYSSTSSYIYSFKPLPPVITIPSGRYSETQYAKIVLDQRAPKDRAYTIKYRRNGDGKDYDYRGYEIEIDHTMAVKAYVVENDGEKQSDNTINYYIIESSSGMHGKVYIGSPYDTSTRFSADVLSEKPYSDGIKLTTDNISADINYYYQYTLTDNTESTTGNMIFDNTMPIFVTPSMKNITITAWLTGPDGNVIEDSQSVFPLEFVHLLVPRPSLADENKITVARGTEYTIINDYPDDNNILIYYTTDGSDPADKDNKGRKLYNGEKLTMTDDLVLKCVYYSACGICASCKDNKLDECWYPVYGRTGTYTYACADPTPTPVPTETPTAEPTTAPTRRPSSGGGGGGSRPAATPTVSPSVSPSAATPDPNAHPDDAKEHKGYINGYPDGSVKPDGNITRAETAAVLYRILEDDAKDEYKASGDVFPDTGLDMWAVQNIEYMTGKNVIKGYDDGTFRPDNSITRAEFAALVRRYIKLDLASDPPSFPDVSPTSWYNTEVEALYRAGYINGYEDGTFRPEQPITRAEAMSIINKVLKRNPDEEYVKSLGLNPYNDLEERKWYYVTVLEATIDHYYVFGEDGFEDYWKESEN